MAADESHIKVIGSESNDLKITFEQGRFADKTTAEKMYFPIETGIARPASTKGFAAVSFGAAGDRAVPNAFVR